MDNNLKIPRIISGEESETVEFKPTLSQKDKIMESVSAFSNTRGGKILIGVSDRGEVIGLDIGKRTLEDLAGYVKQNSDPPVYPSIETVQFENKTLLSLTVKESPEKPVFFNDKAYKRVGRSNQRISSHEIRNMAKEEKKKMTWDEQICEGATLDDIDWDYLENEFIPLYERISKKKVASSPLELLHSAHTILSEKPLNGGILLFGKEPQLFFSHSYIALARYTGTAVGGEKRDYKEFRGNLFSQIDNCYAYLTQHTALMSRLSPGQLQRMDLPEYGRFSLRELVTNAVCHRDYADQGGKIIIKMFDDRIEFFNIGGLPRGVTVHNIVQAQYSRNPIISSLLAKVNYIEEMGEGWDKILEEHRDHPLKPQMPEILPSSHSVQVTLFSTKDKFEEEDRALMSDRQRKILEYLQQNATITSMICMDLLGVSKDTAVRELAKLVSIKRIQRQGSGRGTHYVLL
jgi:ATP-dependent DNA helicase RecG